MTSICWRDSVGQKGAAGTDADQDDIGNPFVAFQNFVGDSGQGPFDASYHP